MNAIAECLDDFIDESNPVRVIGILGVASMRSKECLLNAKKARSEAERSLYPHVKNAFLQIDRLYSRLAEMARVDEGRLDAGAGTANSTPLPAFVLRTAQVRVAKPVIAKSKS